MVLTWANWPGRLLERQDLIRFQPSIQTFNLWCTAQGCSRLPFYKITYWRDGRCCLHNTTNCWVCRSYFGSQHRYNTSASSITAPRSYSPARFSWNYYRNAWPAGSQLDAENRAAAGRHGRADRQHHWARKFFRRDRTRPRVISVPVYSVPEISASPECHSDEVYIFPRTSRRIEIVNEARGTRIQARVPEMTVSDLKQRLVGPGQDLFLRWRGGDADHIHRLSSGKTIGQEIDRTRPLRRRATRSLLIRRR